ncbi:creatininase family protein [Streptomyces sp. NBC_00019]|uniref:creatininase family protein n=1 Tax=Streptomyces sp. NBC_00019 TaxID=2975623 RepID=UPI00324A7861
MAERGALGDSVWPAVPTGALVLVPVGSTEQHGPHLPFDTDTTVAHAVARRTADLLPGPPLVAPPLAYGASGEHADFPGTVSMGHEALRAVLVELTRSLSLWAGRVLFANGHGVARRLDDPAYGAGVWFSALKGRSTAALRPRVTR